VLREQVPSGGVKHNKSVTRKKRWKAEMTQANPTAKDMFETAREAFFGTVKTSSAGDTNLVPKDSILTNPLITTNTGIVEG
jgi:hypothetical protein